ncbi:MAG: hypothetical protein JW942_00600 [Opitutales bacterium]|nr:hypothetical protein [Opitutales bacterium]
MNSSFFAEELCIATCRPGPVCAALYKKNGAGAYARVREWLSGPRPDWLRGALRNGNCILIDATLPTLVDALEADSRPPLEQARERLARIGMDGDAMIRIISKTAYVALRPKALEQSRDIVFGQGIVADFFTSVLALDIARLVREGGSANCASLRFSDSDASLSSVRESRLMARRFKLGESSADLEAAVSALMRNAPEAMHLELLGEAGPLAQTVMEKAADEGWACVNHCCASAEEAELSLMDLLARILTEDKALSPLFAPPRNALRNAALRWLPSLALSLGMLFLATLSPAYAMWKDMQASEARAQDSAARLASAKETAKANAPLAAELESAMALRNVMLDANLSNICELQKLAELHEQLIYLDLLSGLEQIRSDCAKAELLLVGTLAAEKRQGLERLIATLGTLGYTPVEDIVLEEHAERVRYRLNMGGAE